MESVDQLARKAFGLQPTERIRLVEAILYSLDKPDVDIEQSWIAESEARYEAYYTFWIPAFAGMTDTNIQEGPSFPRRRESKKSCKCRLKLKSYQKV